MPAEVMRDFAAELFSGAGMVRHDARFLAGLLVDTDLRGVFSHGTWAAAGYVRMLLARRVNPTPRITIVRETAATLVLDGDGGMGHLPASEAMQWVVAHAKTHGAAAATTRNHFHFGAAGLYSRMALPHDCIGIAMSSHRYLPRQNDDRTIRAASGGSPLSIAVPTGAQPPLVLDMGTNLLPWDDAVFARYPFVYFRGLGLAAAMQALGGILAGIYLPECNAPQSPWESNQGALVFALDVSRFIAIDTFKSEMDRYVSDARSLEPLPGHDRAELAGGLEWQRELDYRESRYPGGRRSPRRARSRSGGSQRTNSVCAVRRDAL